jgi:hypothetical protein
MMRVFVEEDKEDKARELSEWRRKGMHERAFERYLQHCHLPPLPQTRQS